MSRSPRLPSVRTPMAMEQVSGNPVRGVQGAQIGRIQASAQVFNGSARQASTKTDRNQIAKGWQIELYRQINICGEARYAATLFANIAGRADIGISQPQTKVGKVSWVTDGPEVDALAEIAPTVRDRSRLIKQYMIHRVIAGECYLICRERVDTDPGYVAPPNGFKGTWEQYLRENLKATDLFDPDIEEKLRERNPNEGMWEIVAVTEMQKFGESWKVRHDNGNYLTLTAKDPVIRMWVPDPENRQEAWSPYRSMLSTLQEIEWLTKHIFTQVRSRLMLAGVWFLPENLTYAPPPPDAVEGGEAAMASMNDAELFALSLLSTSSQMLDDDEVSFPTVVMADPAALESIDKDKLITFWSTIDDKAMILRSDAVRRFALGMDLPPEQVLGSSGLAVSGTTGSAGSVNHWGVWANEEQTISAHVEPALDDFCGTLTSAIIRPAAPTGTNVVACDTASLRLRQDRSKESIELAQLGALKMSVAVRENGFDPETDMMNDKEWGKWALGKILAQGSWLPEQMQVALKMMGVVLDIPLEDVIKGEGGDPNPGGAPGQSQPSNTDHIEEQGPPHEQHDHSDAPFTIQDAAAEMLCLRALEKMGNKGLNDHKRGKEYDRGTPPHMAHVLADLALKPGAEDFDFSLANIALEGASAAEMAATVWSLGHYCADLYERRAPYTRSGMLDALKEA